MFAWRIPVDDGSHLGFNVWLHHDGGPAPRDRGEKRGSQSPIASWTVQEVGAAFRR
jgi:hypothetical protein